MIKVMKFCVFGILISISDIFSQHPIISILLGVMYLHELDSV